VAVILFLYVLIRIMRHQAQIQFLAIVVKEEEP
jgi:hypothetical protein